MSRSQLGNVIHANIDIHRRMLIDEFSLDGVKSISELQSHCENMTFSEKIRYDRLFQHVTHKGG